MTFLEHQHGETFKGCWHLGGLVFAAGATAYNVAALLQRREPHLLVNSAVYMLLTAYEAQKVAHHWREP